MTADKPRHEVFSRAELARAGWAFPRTLVAPAQSPRPDSCSGPPTGTSNDSVTLGETSDDEEIHWGSFEGMVCVCVHVCGIYACGVFVCVHVVCA